MTDPTFSTLAFIGLAFGGVAAASLLMRAVLIVGGAIRAMASTAQDGPPSHPLQISRAT